MEPPRRFELRLQGPQPCFLGQLEDGGAFFQVKSPVKNELKGFKVFLVPGCALGKEKAIPSTGMK